MGIQAIGAIESGGVDELNRQAMGIEQIDAAKMSMELRELQDPRVLEKAVSKMMDVKDLDKDGRLGQKELGFSDSVFRKIDTNKNGYIEDAELRAKVKETKEFIRNIADVAGLIEGGPSMQEMQKLMGGAGRI